MLQQTAYFPVNVIRDKHKGGKTELRSKQKKKRDVSCILQKEGLNKGTKTDL